MVVKRIMVTMLVILVLALGGAAFAADSMSHADVSVPDITQVQNTLSNGTVDSVIGFTPDDAAALTQYLEEAGFDPGLVNSINWSKVVVTLNSGMTTIVITIDDAQVTFMRNSAGQFVRVYGVPLPRGLATEVGAEGEAKNVTTITIEKGGAFDLSSEAGKIAFDIAKLEYAHQDGGSSGCSAMTVGALALFFVPMSVMVTRRSKK